MNRPWKLAYQKLFYFQKKIQLTKNARSLRNFQRFSNRNRFIQLLIIQNWLGISTNFRQSKKILTFQFLSQLWTLSLHVNPNIKFLTGQKSLKIYETLCIFCKDPNIQYIFIDQLKNFLSQEIKYWISSNIFIEKKFF